MKLNNLMTIINNFLFENPNINVERVLHFFFAAWFVAEFKFFGCIYMIIGLILISLLSLFKEKCLDSYFDNGDFFASILGGLFSVLIYYLNNIL